MHRVQEREAALNDLRAEREWRAHKKREWVKKYGECEDPNAWEEDEGPVLPPKGIL